MSRKKTWQSRVGRHGARVTVRERVVGGPVYMLWWDGTLKGRRKRSLKFRVRGPDGELIKERVKRAEVEALAKSSELLRDEVPDPRATLGQAVDLYRREVVAEQLARQEEDTQRELTLWENRLGRSYVLDAFSISDWNGFRRDRESGRMDAQGLVVVKPENRRPVGKRAVAKSLKVLRHLCRVAVEHRLLATDPTRGFELPTEANPKRPVYDDDRYEKLLELADQITMYGPKCQKVPTYLPTLLVLAHDTGRRISAILALRWSDWLPDYTSNGGLRWRAEHDKVKRESVIPVTTDVKQALERFRTEHPGVGEALMFPVPKDHSRPVTQQTAARWLREAERKAELEHLQGGVWHPLRRAWATSRKGLSVKDVAEAGGWKDTTTLLKCYQHADPETLEEVVNSGRRLRLA